MQFTDTGDSLIDAWEEQLAAGETPNLEEAFTAESLEKIRTRKNSSRTIAGGSSLRDTVASVEREAAKTGLSGTNAGLSTRQGWSRKPLFGDGSED